MNKRDDTYGCGGGVRVVTLLVSDQMHQFQRVKHHKIQVKFDKGVNPQNFD